MFLRAASTQDVIQTFVFRLTPIYNERMPLETKGIMSPSPICDCMETIVFYKQILN